MAIHPALRGLECSSERPPQRTWTPGGAWCRTTTDFWTPGSPSSTRLHTPPSLDETTVWPLANHVRLPATTTGLLVWTSRPSDSQSLHSTPGTTTICQTCPSEPQGGTTPSLPEPGSGLFGDTSASSHFLGHRRRPTSGPSPVLIPAARTTTAWFSSFLRWKDGSHSLTSDAPSFSDGIAGNVTEPPSSGCPLCDQPSCPLTVPFFCQPEVVSHILVSPTRGQQQSPHTPRRHSPPQQQHEQEQRPTQLPCPILLSRTLFGSQKSPQ